MRWKWLSGVVAVAALLIGGLSCARNQHLVSLQVQPSGAVFGAGDSTLAVDFRAYGTFEHPPETKDLTSQVTWITDTPQVATVNAHSVAGEVSPVDLSCGAANVSATFKDGGNLVLSNAAHVVVDGPASSGCTPAGPQPILTVTFSGNGSGTVTSSPAGISCNSPSSCSNTFTAGTTVTLTATPSATFGAWTAGCNQSLANQCTVVMQNNVTVTAMFN
jgi:hypothetical protein